MRVITTLIFICVSTLNCFSQIDSVKVQGERVSLETKYIRTAKSFHQIQKLLAIMPLSSPQWDFVPSIYPIRADKARISSSFGYRFHPIDGGIAFHAAIDIPCTLGEKVYATASGLVMQSVTANGGLGNHIMINHINGFLTVYGHLSRCLVHSGDYVNKGQLIGLAGATGKATGVHVHYGIKKDRINIDPYPFCFVSKNKFLSDYNQKKQFRVHGGNKGKAIIADGPGMIKEKNDPTEKKERKHNRFLDDSYF